MEKKYFYPLLSLLLCFSMFVQAQPQDKQKPVKVACVGNSITFGAGIANREKDSYPMQLGQMLGSGYDVRNFGVSGSTMIQKDRSYMAQKAFKEAVNFAPDILIVKLGTNDTNPTYWKYKSEFSKDMNTMLDAFRKKSPNVKIYLCHPVTMYAQRLKDREKVLTSEVIPMIDKVVKQNNATVIDLHTPTQGMPENYVDGLHPDEMGANVIARTVYKALTGKETTQGLQPYPGTATKWKDFDRYDFTYKKKKAIVVAPKTARPGNPWIWRPAFFGNSPAADVELLKQGFYVVFYDVTHQYGSPQSIKQGNDFYREMTNRYGLAKHVALEGYSRGGYFALRWAIANPEKVACLYLDNPVCDMFSWPGRQRAKQWGEFLKNWDIDDNITPATFKGNPIDNLKPLAEHHVPILAVCGDADKTVPFKDNMLALRNAYTKLGGPVELVIKPGADHHPHSLEKPEPIVDFVVRHSEGYAIKQYVNPRGSLQNSYLKFENEKEGCVAFLGGSITHMKGWRDQIKEQLKQRFPFTKFRFIEVGIPSAGTTPHAFRVDNDVLSKGNVDLLFVEGAVNDNTNGFGPCEQIRGMEGIVRHALTANPYTDIIMLHFVYEPFLKMYDAGRTPDVILNHERVANHYLIPSAECAKQVAQRIREGEFTWKEFGGVHPKWMGHKLYTADIASLFDTLWSNPASFRRTAHELPKNVLDPWSYDRGEFVALEKAKIQNGWQIVQDWTPAEKVNTRGGFVHVPMLCADKPGATFSFKFKGRGIGLFMACGPKSATLEYSIDRKPFRTLDTFTNWSKRLYLPWLYVLDAELDANKEHEVVVRISSRKNSKSLGTECVIRNIVVNK